LSEDELDAVALAFSLSPMHQGDVYAILSGVFWSMSVILMRVSGLHIPPLPLTIFKSAVAVCFFVLASQALGEAFVPELSGEAYVRLVVSAVLGISMADTMFASALNRLGASLQALADCVYAPAIAVVGFMMFGEWLGFWELLGGLLVVSGVVVGMRVTPDVKSRRDLVIGVFLTAGAHVIMAVGILFVRDVYREVSVVWVSGFRFLVATIVLVVFASCQADRGQMFLAFRRRDLWKAMLPMTFLGPFLATICWVAGFKYSFAGRAAIYNQLSTVFIIVLAVIFLKERLTGRKALGVALAIVGALLVASN
jgi:drug/metabolite transporter (DMT)-like permease